VGANASESRGTWLVQTVLESLKGVTLFRQVSFLYEVWNRVAAKSQEELAAALPGHWCQYSVPGCHKGNSFGVGI